MERSIRIPESGACVSVGAQISRVSRGRTLRDDRGINEHSQTNLALSVVDPEAIDDLYHHAIHAGFWIRVSFWNFRDSLAIRCAIFYILQKFILPSRAVIDAPLATRASVGRVGLSVQSLKISIIFSNLY